MSASLYRVMETPRMIAPAEDREKQDTQHKAVTVLLISHYRWINCFRMVTSMYIVLLYINIMLQYNDILVTVTNCHLIKYCTPNFSTQQNVLTNVEKQRKVKSSLLRSSNDMKKKTSLYYKFVWKVKRHIFLLHISANTPEDRMYTMRHQCYPLHHYATLVCGNSYSWLTIGFFCFFWRERKVRERKW